MTSRTYASAPSLAMMRQALATSFCDEPSNDDSQWRAHDRLAR